MFGAAIAAWVAGVVREHVGDYAAAFVAAGWIAIIAGFAALAIRRGGPDATTPTRSEASAAAQLTALGGDARRRPGDGGSRSGRAAAVIAGQVSALLRGWSLRD